MLQRRFWTAIVLGAVLGSIHTGATAQSATTAATKAATPGALALQAGAKVAEWQLSHMDNFEYVPAEALRRDTEATRDWVQAAFYIGLTQFADVSGIRKFSDAVIAHGAAEQWSFDHRPRHADSDATGAVWVWAAERTQDTAKLAPIKARFDAVLADPSKISLDFEPKPPAGGQPYCQVRWCWCDALFMAPPAWIALSRVTGDRRYLAHADAEFWASADYLYDKQDHLFYRDSRFFTQRDAAGRKIFWSRGNGWVFAGLARILNELPANHPSRTRYATLFQQMAKKVVTLQGAQGYWPVSLLQPQQTPETSGTGFFTYGLAWGVNQRLLPAAEYRPAVDRGWRALLAAVQPDGKLGWVQRIGTAPDTVTASDTQLYGVGALLLAASEVSKLLDANGQVPQRQ
jgi:rhamnogalacturonyl hydrolase YesR